MRAARAAAAVNRPSVHRDIKWGVYPACADLSELLRRLQQKGNNMEVIVAKTAGFCFGVKRAVDQVYEQIE